MLIQILNSFFKKKENKMKKRKFHKSNKKNSQNSFSKLPAPISQSSMLLKNDKDTTYPIQMNQKETVELANQAKTENQVIKTKNKEKIYRGVLWKPKIEKYEFPDDVNIETITTNIIKSFTRKVNNNNANVKYDSFYIHNREVNLSKFDSLEKLIEENSNFKNKLECKELRKNNFLFLNKMKDLKTNIEGIIDYFYLHFGNDNIDQTDEDICKFKLLLSDSIHRKRDILDTMFEIRERICRIVLMAQESWNIAIKYYNAGKKENVE